MHHLTVTNPEFMGLSVGDTVDHIRRTTGGEVTDELYPVDHFNSASLRAEAARDDVEYLGRWRIASIAAAAESGAQRSVTVEVEPA